LLKLSNIAVAEFRTPFESWWVIAFHIVERPMSVKSRHVLAELVNMTLHDYARLTVCPRWVGLGSLHVSKG